MKKNWFWQRFAGVFSLTACLFLVACGNQNLTFEQAQEIAMKNSNLISDLLLGSDQPSQQSLSITASLDDADTTVYLTLNTVSQEDRAGGKSKVELDLDADVTAMGSSTQASVALTAFMNTEQLFFNIEKLGINSNDESINMMTALLHGLEGQRFQLPITGGEGLRDGINEYLKSLATLGKQEADLFVQTGDQPYQWTFDRFNGSKAYQFSLDQDKTSTFLQEVSAIVHQFNLQTIDAFIGDIGSEEMPSLLDMDIQIPVFEGNLVIVGKKQVAIVVDHFEIYVDGISLVGSYRYGPDGIVLQMKEKESWLELLSISILKSKRSTYTLDIHTGMFFRIQGTIETSASRSQLGVAFDFTLTISEDGQSSLEIPLKWEWKYTTIKSIDFTPPTDAVDISDMLSGLLDADLLGWLYDDEYYYSYDESEYADLYNMLLEDEEYMELYNTLLQEEWYMELYNEMIESGMLELELS